MGILDAVQDMVEAVTRTEDEDKRRIEGFSSCAMRSETRRMLLLIILAALVYYYGFRK